MEDKSNDLLESNEEFSLHEFKDLSISEIAEEILKNCGGYGLFQKRLTSLILIFTIFLSQTLLTMVFIREKVPFSCYPSNFNKSLIPPNITLDEFLDNVTVEEQRCSVYNLDSEGGYYILPNDNSTKEPCNNGRKFYTEDMSSIVSEFDLVCGREWVKNIVVSAMFGGFLAGNLIFGLLSDKFGRFKMCCVGNIMFICCGLAKIHSPNFSVFLVLYFLEGFGYGGFYINLYGILIECVSQNHRMRLNFLMHGVFALGEMCLAGVAYVLREWQHLLYAATIPHILIFIVALKYLPESPRWLLIQGRFAEAEKSFNRIARINKKLNEYTGRLILNLQRVTESKAKVEAEVYGNMNPENKTYTAIDLLKKPRRAMITTNIWFCWFVNSMLYYGVTLNSADMSGNSYLNFFMMSAIEIPASILGWVAFKWFGHRKPLCFFMVFSGINCILSTFVPTGNFWLPLMLAVFGKLGATASYDGVYLTSAELFPTAVRNSGMGTASSFARGGGMIAPIILGLSVYGSWIPLSVYGVFGIVSGFLILLLPEMKDVCLLQTLEDMDNW